MVSRRSSKKHLIILVKSPIQGRVKTRLQPELNQKKSLEIYRAFVFDFLRTIDKDRDYQKIVAYSGSFKHLEGLVPQGFHVVGQGRGSLGNRMLRMFDWSRKQKAEKTVIVGSDSPTLPVCSFETAFQTLDDHDVVFGPAWDGGFYLIGTRTGFQTEFFKGVEWSSRLTLTQTIHRIKKFGKKIGVLFPWYDIDYAKDLRLLYAEFLCVPSLRKVLKKTYSQTISILKSQG